MNVNFGIGIGHWFRSSGARQSGNFLKLLLYRSSGAKDYSKDYCVFWL
jgi:hypothetical protein